MHPDSLSDKGLAMSTIHRWKLKHGRKWASRIFCADEIPEGDTGAFVWWKVTCSECLAMRSKEKGLWKKGKPSKITPEKKKDARLMRRRNLSYREIAEKLDVAYSTAWNAVNSGVSNGKDRADRQVF